MMQPWQMVGIALAGAGIGVLYLAWRQKQRSWLHISAGWGLLIGSQAAWAQTSGIDKGPALGIVVAMLAALAALFAAALRTPVKHRRAPRTRIAASASPAAIRHDGLAKVATILAITLAGMVVSVAACTALFLGNRALGLEHTANLTLTMFAFPLLWAGLATFIGYADSLRGRASLLFLVVAISAIIILGSGKAG
ncbi:MAG: hypothetical protein HLUCCX21_07375 [Porphyrobacter sp. HL-46]|nr:MAG: hypothetical protein HLUCCX21_07375 [Porphyrobacter sp. HL-46]